MIWICACLTCTWSGLFLGCVLFLTHVFFSPTHFSWTPVPSLHGVSYRYDWSNSYKTEAIASDYSTWQNRAPPYRVAGSMHSNSPLVTNSVLLVQSGIIDSNATHVRAYAGTQLEDVQKHIAPYTMRGLGSIVKQTLGGSFSTSLAGIETVSFSQFVEEIEYVTPDGVFRTQDLYHLKDTMGMIGIITEMTVRIFPNRKIEFFSEFSIPLEEADKIAGYDVVDSIIQNDQIHVVTYNKTEVTTETRRRPSGSAIFWDLFGLPLMIPSGVRKMAVRSSLKSTQDLRTIGANEAIYGSVFAEFRIPMENCSSFLNVLDADAIVRVKYLKPRNDACLSYTGETCKVEIYYTRYQTPKLFDDQAFHFGGYPHWGKLSENVTRFLHGFECFGDVPVHEAFLNDFLKGGSFTPWNGADRVWWTRLWQVVALTYIARCVVRWFRKKHKRKIRYTELKNSDKI